MLTYFVYKMFIYDILIQGYLFNGDCLERALGLFGIIIFGMMGIMFVVADILSIPLYLLIGIFTLIFKIIDKLRGVK